MDTNTNKQLVHQYHYQKWMHAVMVLSAIFFIFIHIHTQYNILIYRLFPLLAVGTHYYFIDGGDRSDGDYEQNTRR